MPLSAWKRDVSNPSRAGSSPARLVSVRTAASAASRLGRRRRRSSGIEASSSARRTRIRCSAIEHSWSDRSTWRVMGRADANSIQADGLMRRIEREGRDGDLEAFACTGLHLVAADHDAGWRREWRAGGIFETLARRQYRFLADDTRPAHLLLAPHPIGNPPMATPKLNGFPALVLDADLIRPLEVIFRGGGVVLEIEGLDGDLDRTRELRLHGRVLRGVVIGRSLDGALLRCADRPSSAVSWVD